MSALDEVRKIVRASGWKAESAAVLLVGFRPGAASARAFRTRTEEAPPGVPPLHVVVADQETRVVPIAKREGNPYEDFLFVGRVPTSDMVLDDASISKSHAAFQREGTRWFLKDNKSRNGTYVDGRKLAPGERVAIAGGVQITFGAVATYFLDGARMAQLG